MLIAKIEERAGNKDEKHNRLAMYMYPDGRIAIVAFLELLHVDTCREHHDYLSTCSLYRIPEQKGNVDYSSRLGATTRRINNM